MRARWIAGALTLLLAGTVAAPAEAATRPDVGRTIANALRSPWGAAFLPDGSALVTLRDPGTIVRVRPTGGRVTTVRHVPGVVSSGRSGGEGGLLGIALHPDFARQPWVYVYYTTRSDNRVARMRWSNGRLGAPHVLLKGIRKALHHNGGGLAFSPGGALYVSTGDALVASRAQSKTSLNGKILRMTDTGKVPTSNPFRGSYVWSLGHRNVEGLQFDDKGRLWATEFGDHAWDELNLIRKGRNYGWPRVEGRTTRAGITSPLGQWRPAAASPSGFALAKSYAWIATLRGQRLMRVSLTTGRTTAYWTGRWGRLRNVVRAPDGSLWLLTSNTDGRLTPRRGDDRIVRLTLRS